MQMTKILLSRLHGGDVVAASCLGSRVAMPAAAAPAEVIALPGATSAEGIAAGKGTTFYAGDLFAGDIFRGDINEAPLNCSSTLPRAAWPQEWPPTSNTTCCLWPVASPRKAMSTTP